jgi:ribosomal small subunit protein bTHX
MGKGDKRTRRGKLFAGSHGKTRSRRTNKAVATWKKNKKRAAGAR